MEANNKDKKVYIKQLKDKTKEFIKSHPYFIRNYKQSKNKNT